MIAAMLLAAGVACGHPPVGSPPPSVHAARRYELFAPSNRPGMPLVIVLHPGEHTGHEVREITGFDRVAAREEFVVVYPDGIDRHWNDGRPEIATGADDVGFIAWLIDELAVTRHIDRTRVYVTGLSNGAMMAYRLGCQLADRIAAIAPVAGTMPAAIARCQPTAPLSVLAILGTADPIVPIAGGELTSHHGRVHSGAGSLAPFAARAGCGDALPRVDEPDWDPADGSRVRRTRYRCPPPIEIELVALDGAGHTWPGGPQYLPIDRVGGVNRDIDGAERVWQFFARHARSGMPRAPVQAPPMR